MKERIPKRPSGPNFADKGYLPSTGFIDSSLIRVEKTFGDRFYEIEDSGQKLKDESGSVQPFRSKRATIPLSSGEALVEERRYGDDGGESVFVSMDCSLRGVSAAALLEMYEDHTYKLFLVDKSSAEALPVTRADENIAIMYCSQKLNEAAGLASS